MNNTTRQRRIFVSGASRLSPNAAKLWRELGSLLAKENGVIVITGGLAHRADDPSALTADRMIVDGMLPVLKARGDVSEDHIETVLPDPSHDWNKLIRFKEGRIRELEKRNAQSRRFSMVHSCDVVISVEGEHGTRSVLDAALAIERPILPLPFGGGASGAAWLAHREAITKWFQIEPFQAEAFDQIKLPGLNEMEIRELALRVHACLMRGLSRAVPLTEHADQIFICAKSSDFHHARQVFEFLKSRGIGAFLSDESLPERGSSDYRKEIDRALDQADHMVVVASTRKNVESPWVEAEWGFFINEKRSGRKTGNLVTLITGHLQLSDLPPSLRYYEVLPLQTEALEKLLRYVRKFPPPGLIGNEKLPDDSRLSSTQKKLLAILQSGPQCFTEIVRSLRDIHGSETRTSEVRGVIEEMIQNGLVIVGDDERHGLTKRGLEITAADSPATAVSASRKFSSGDPQGEVSDESDIMVRIDPQLNNGDRGKALRMPYVPDRPVYDFLDEIYYFLVPGVEQFSFGKTWMLVDVETEKTFEHLQNNFDQRPLLEAGIKPGAVLLVKPL
jgi:hypothetical protein